MMMVERGGRIKRMTMRRRKTVAIKIMKWMKMMLLRTIIMVVMMVIMMMMKVVMIVVLGHRRHSPDPVHLHLSDPAPHISNTAKEFKKRLSVLKSDFEEVSAVCFCLSSCLVIWICALKQAAAVVAVMVIMIVIIVILVVLLKLLSL